MQKKVIVLCMILVLCPILLPYSASASNYYLIPDSDTRILSEGELWEWQYDALGFVLNEIFARHGFPFDPDDIYYAYFSTQSWYTYDKNFSYDSLNSVEWRNEHLIKQVRQQMKDMDTKNQDGMPLPDSDPALLNIPVEFEEYALAPGQKLSVFSGPGTQYLRAENGNATLSTYGSVYGAGIENGWLMVLYRTNDGSARIGYVDSAVTEGNLHADMLLFDYINVMMTKDCSITDDPIVHHGALATLHKWDEITYLCTLHNDGEWAYVEAETSAGPVRGCIPMDAFVAIE